MEKKNRIQKLRNEVKDSIKKVKEQFLFQSPQEMVKDMQKNRPVADMLVETALYFMEKFSEKSGSGTYWILMIWSILP